MNSIRCRQCEHYIEANARESKIYGCDRSKCVFEPTAKNAPIDYCRAFKIACELLNGAVLYGIDADKIYEIMAAKDGVVSSDSYESYILNNLQELDRGQYASESTTKNDLGVDCISRVDAIRAMQDKAKKLTNEDTINGLCGAVAILFELPSVTPQQRWIPTSERLPEEDGEYYATVYDTDENYKYMDIAELEDGIWQYKDYVKVLAWMPLPQAYREVKDGNDD